MSDSVSNTGIIAIISSRIGIFIYIAITDTAPPKSSEPVSPMNTFAGCKLNNKKARHIPIKLVPNITISFVPVIIPIAVKHVSIIVVTDVASPSIPSV